MKFLKVIFTFLLLVLIVSSCRYFFYTPRSKSNIHREQPSLLLLEKIVEFRLENLGWPTSKEDFMNKGIKYQKVFEGFPYNYTEFKRIDSNKMIFYFTDHIKDSDNYYETGKINLNSYNGRVTFYKDSNKFIWKLKMR